jgi:hypothetical protein
MEQRDDWIRELERRQDNIDPIRRIPNGALFEGTLIKGTRQLNKVQRVGAILLGFSSLAVGCFCIAEAFASLRSWSSPNWDITYVIFAPLSLWAGWRITANALANDPQKNQHKKN